MPYQRGSDRHCAKMTEDKVLAMRKDRTIPCECGRLPSFKSLGEKYGVSAVSAYKICSGKDWKHLLGEGP